MPANDPTSESLQGWVADLSTPQAKAQAIERAFDYRGDVTLKLADGSIVEGFVLNRDAAADPPFVEVFPKSSSEKRTIRYDEIVGISFTGADTAAGKSWDGWLKKVAQAEASGTIAELYPEETD